MLLELHIRDLAIIEEQSISFGAGFNVITGETGAGKSLLLNAVALILGEKASQDLIRAGAESAEVQALFDLSQLSEAILAELPEYARGNELVVSRTISRSGRSKIYVNGRLATLALLEEISGKLINICQQSQHIRLLNSQYHLELVDNFAGNKSLRDQYAEIFTVWRDLKQRIEEYERRKRSSELRAVELAMIVEDLKAIDLRSGIRLELENDVKKLGNAEKILQGCQDVLFRLEGEAGAFQLLGGIAGQMQDLTRYDSGLQNYCDVFQNAYGDLQQVCVDLNKYADGISLDQEKLEQLRDQLAEIARLERKYRTNDAGLLELLEQSKNELEQLLGAEQIDQLKEKFARQQVELQSAAVRLRKSRQEAGVRLAELVERELQELNMAEARLEVLVENGDFSHSGADRLEIMIATNKGEPPNALRKIASGGELSRIMLVLKKILRERSGVNVLIFDEVDVGISGSVARAVGEKLRDLAQYSQVICITHLAQVASLADHHFLVKKISGERTVAQVNKLEEEQRVEEVARMVAGYKVTAASRSSARELLDNKKR